ncbi:MAG TPA: hypothetical protein VM286_04330 [Candidatus Thermoplasmatota archaeon]|nr:hypothetical protein [Candidatus Thermoplasmatota archaeon]
MQSPRALLVALTLTTLLLAGCSGGSSDGGFTVKAPAQPGGAYEFTADVKADEYTWDLGDHLTVASGKTVSHTYDFKDGEITVTLKTTTGGDVKEYNQKVIVGSGTNQKATFLMEAQTDWAITGETIKFSAARSSDPEHDPLRFSWSCLRTADAVRVAAHTHPVVGQPFASPPAGSVTTGKTNRTLPSPDQTLSGDFCEALGPGTAPSTSMTTIAGSFQKTGIYSIYLLAADGAHPTTSGEYKIYVTSPADRPNPVVRKVVSGTLTGGAGGVVNNVCRNENNPSPQDCDQAHDSFELNLGGLVLMANFSFEPTVPNTVPGAPATAVTWTISRGSGALLSGGAGHFVVDQPSKLSAGTFPVEVKVTGGQATYNLEIYALLDMDPAKVYA